MIGPMVAAPEPAPDGARQRVVEVPADVEEGRRARAAVHVLVRAPDGEVGPRRREGDRHGAHRVRQVPEGQRACPCASAVTAAMSYTKADR